MAYSTLTLDRLSSEHREALAWFAERTGEEIPWPGPLESGLHLVNRAKGIHKPVGWRYALSVRETLSAQYDDMEPEAIPGGGWRYEYFQEGNDPARRDHEYTNRALVACMEDGVPVAVLRQTQGKPNVKYHVLGLARVRGWADGWFSLEGIPQDGGVDLSTSIPPEEGDQEPFSPDSITDARQRTYRTIVQRRGQAAFRKALIEAYNGQCAITGCDVLDVLEAAHIHPYRGEQTNNPANGLLLRADLHTLFDLGLLSVRPGTFEVALVPRLRTPDSPYVSLCGTRIKVPSASELQPSKDALRWHFEHVAAIDRT